MRRRAESITTVQQRHTFGKPIDVPQAMVLGAQLFRDPALSASGKLACAPCHDPANAFAPSTDLPIQPGGAGGTSIGMRAAPSLRYLHDAPPFSEKTRFADGDVGPGGGFGHRPALASQGHALEQAHHVVVLDDQAVSALGPLDPRSGRVSGRLEDLEVAAGNLSPRAAAVTTALLTHDSGLAPVVSRW